MKKVVRTIAVVALMFASIAVSAKEPKLSLTANAQKSVVFELDAQTQNTFISMLDKNGNVIYSEKIEVAKGYAKKFDLNGLPEGKYYLHVENTMKETVYTLEVTASSVSIVTKDENNKPVFRKEGGRVFLNLLNLDLEAVSIKVYDSENRIVHVETVNDEMLVEKVFNFEKAYSGIYTVAVVDGNDTYYEEVIVK